MSIFGAFGLAASVIVAGVFLAAALAKLADPAGTRTAVSAFGVPAGLARLSARVLPVAELTVAVLILSGPTRTVGGAAALGLLAIFSLAVAVRLAHGDAPDCHCFGQLHSAPGTCLSWVSSRCWSPSLPGVRWRSFRCSDHMERSCCVSMSSSVD